MNLKLNEALLLANIYQIKMLIFMDKFRQIITNIVGEFFRKSDIQYLPIFLKHHNMSMKWDIKEIDSCKLS